VRLQFYLEHYTDLHSCPLSLVGAPHYVETDDIYNGYLIPAGSIVMPNIWYTFALIVTDVSGQLKLLQEHVS
jgi:hypothetical protein